MCFYYSFKIIVLFHLLLLILEADGGLGVFMPKTEELRSQIEAIDEEIIDLIATRMEIADELAKAKKVSSEGYWDSEKEREVIDRYHELCEEVSLSENEARQIAEVILHISKDWGKLLACYTGI